MRVPRDKPHAKRERHGDHSSIGEALSDNRILIAITFLTLVVVGAIVALATGSWWAVVLAATVHALGTYVVLTTLASAARQVEHVSPTATGALAKEGVAEPGRTAQRPRRGVLGGGQRTQRAARRPFPGTGPRRCGATQRRHARRRADRARRRRLGRGPPDAAVGRAGRDGLCGGGPL
jgi:hypothetical protein